MLLSIVGATTLFIAEPCDCIGLPLPIIGAFLFASAFAVLNSLE